MQTAANLLGRGAAILNERAREYDRKDGPGGEPGERSAAAAVRAFNAITGRDLSESEGWLFLSVLKLVRLQTAPGPHDDSATDAAVYAALMGESKGRAACPESGDEKCPAEACQPQCPIGPDKVAPKVTPNVDFRMVDIADLPPDHPVCHMIDQLFKALIPGRPAESDGYHWCVWCPVNGWLRVCKGPTLVPGGNWSESVVNAVRFTSAADAVKEARKWNNAQVRSVATTIGGSR